MAKKTSKNPPKGTDISKKTKSSALFVGIAAAVFFLVTCLCADENIKPVSLVLALAALALGALRFDALRERMHLPLLALALVVVMGGVSSFYAQSGKLALQEFLKLLAAFCAAVALTLVFAGKGKAPARKMATVLETSAAVSALVSLDLLSTRLLSGAVLAVLGSMDSFYAGLEGVEAGVRLTSIFRNPNIFAGCVGIGTLLSLSLAMSSEGKSERRLHLCCLYICSVAFVLAFSMGAVAAIAAAFLVYLALEHPQRRAGLLLLMIKTLVLAAVSVVLISVTSLDRWDGFQPLPLICIVAGSALLCLAEEKLEWFADKLHSRGRLVALCAGGVLVLIVGFAVAAYNITGGISLSAGEGISRSAYPSAGEYSVSTRGGEGLELEIVSQSRADTMMHTQQLLYSGVAEGAAFTVPEDSTVVYFRLRATQDTKLEGLDYSGQSGSGSVPLDYKLLPDFIANRIQGLFANQNAIQRLVFFEDGLKLFALSPFIGNGMGAFENGVQSVQSFHYETKYVHNHYIQTLLETGVLGLAIFVFLLAVCALAIAKARRRQDFHPLVPALAAVLMFMVIHGGVEVVFSSFCYLPLACGVFLLINECCGDQLPLPGGEKLKGGLAIGMGALVLVYSGCVASGMIARSTAQREMSYESFETAVAMDAFEWSDYALTYIIEAANDANAPDSVLEKADEYAERLDKGTSNTLYYYLTDYYLARDNVEKGMEMAEKHLLCITSNSDEWNDLLYMLRLHNPSGSAFEEGMERISALLESWQQENMGEIVLNEENRSFMDQVLSR